MNTEQRIVGTQLDTLIANVDARLVNLKYRFTLTPFLIRRVKEGSYSQAAQRQFWPDLQELQDLEGFRDDPTNENQDRVGSAAAIIHTYENRALLQLTNYCPAYCRFCFRKAFVGHRQYRITEEALENALVYVQEHPEITDLVLSGGDPLVLGNDILLPILKRLCEFKQLRAIRLDSRVLTTRPERIDDDLLAHLQADGRYWFHAHMNHPDDINHDEIFAAIRRLQAIGVPVYNQCVLLAGINDDPKTMTKLMLSCYYQKVMPYNLYIADRVAGTAHFQVPDEQIAIICKALKDLPGPAQPTLVYVDEHNRKHRSRYDDSVELRHFLWKRQRSLCCETSSVSAELGM